MKVEVLASVMNASLPETVQHMNLQSDAVIINQCDRLGQEEMQISQGNGRIRFYRFPERGIGRSRRAQDLSYHGAETGSLVQLRPLRSSQLRSPPGKLITFRNYVFPAVWWWRQVQQRRGQSVFNAVY